MKKLFLAAFALTAASLFADSSYLSLQLSPGVSVPTFASSPVFGLGGLVRFGAQYQVPDLPLFVSAAVGYDYDSAPAGVPLSVSVTSVSLGGGLKLGITPWMAVQTRASVGYFLSFLNDLSTSGGNPFLSAGIGATFLPGPWHIDLGGAYRYYFGLYNGVEVFAGVSYDLIQSATPKTRQRPAVQPLRESDDEQTLEQAGGSAGQEISLQAAGSLSGFLELKDVSLDDIYPSLRTWYITHSLGKVTIHNGQDKAVSDLRVTFQVREFMTDPVDCHAPTTLGPGGSESVDLFGLFTHSIIEMTEKTKALAAIDVWYTLDGRTRHQRLVQAVRVMDRDATSWTDDRRAAAFVTSRDPVVVFFSRNVNEMVQRGTLNPNLSTAIAVFEALQLYGMTYSADPVPTQAEKGTAVDAIQFPRETLEYRKGKSSDVAVLYGALLESAGVETALITVPGHVFVAFSAGAGPDDARRTLGHPDDLIIRDAKSWIPVEVTENVGFLQAWQDGARLWKEKASRQQAAFYPLRDAWLAYDPVALPGETSVNLPIAQLVARRYQDDVNKLTGNAPRDSGTSADPGTAGQWNLIR